MTDSVRERGGLVVEERFDDLDGSSETLEREALQRLMREIEAGHIDCVVVTYIDRLTRRQVDLAQLLEFFEQHNIQLSVLTDPQFGETAANRLLSNIVAAASQFQQELTRERMVDAPCPEFPLLICFCLFLSQDGEQVPLNVCRDVIKRQMAKATCREWILQFHADLIER
jgi:hypothetical protein